MTVVISWHRVDEAKSDPTTLSTTGVPDAVVDRAWEILAELESHGLATGPRLRAIGEAAPDAVREPAPDALREPVPAPAPSRKGPKTAPQAQVDLFQPAVVEVENPLHRKAYEEILRLELDSLSPMQVMMKIHELKARLAEAAEVKRPAAAGRPG